MESVAEAAPADEDIGGSLRERLALVGLQVENLTKALESSRVIGIAVGIIMAMQKVTRDSAFDVLRQARQHQNRKLRVIADGVVEYGVIIGRGGPPTC